MCIRDSYNEVLQFFLIVLGFLPLVFLGLRDAGGWSGLVERCLLYTSDAADERSSVDLGGRRIIKKKKKE